MTKDEPFQTLAECRRTTTKPPGSPNSLNFDFYCCYDVSPTVGAAQKLRAPSRHPRHNVQQSNESCHSTTFLKKARGVALAVDTATTGAVTFVAAVFHAMAAVAVQAAVVLGSQHCSHLLRVGQHVGLGRHGQVDVAVAFAVDRAGARAVAFIAAVLHSGTAATFKAAVVLAVDLHGGNTSGDGNERCKNHKSTERHY
jgi:hypothetical protein